MGTAGKQNGAGHMHDHHTTWRYGVDQTDQQERAEMRAAQAAGLVDEYMRGQLNARNGDDVDHAKTRVDNGVDVDVDLPTGEAVPAPVPAPVVLGSGKPYVEPSSESQIQELLRLHRERKIEPVDIELGPLPDDALDSDKAAAAMLKLRFGLRLTDGTDEPMMCATSVLVDEGIVATQAGASKLLHRLEDHGVIWSPGNMPAIKGRPDGTRVFLPGPKPTGPEPAHGWTVRPTLDRVPGAVFEAGAVPVEREDVRAASAAAKPVGEPQDEPGVRHAVRRAPAGSLDGASASEGSAWSGVARQFAAGVVRVSPHGEEAYGEGEMHPSWAGVPPF